MIEIGAAQGPEIVRDNEVRLILKRSYRLTILFLEGIIIFFWRVVTYIFFITVLHLGIYLINF